MKNDYYIILLSQHVVISVDRACDLPQPAVRRLGAQHGNLRCNQQLRGGVCVTVCVLSVCIGKKPVPWSSCVPDCWKWSDYRPRDAVRAIKKRIVGNKNFKEVMLALTVSVHSYLHSYHLIRHQRWFDLLCPSDGRSWRPAWRTAATGFTSWWQHGIL